MIVPEPLLRYQRRSLTLGGFLVAACYAIDVVQPNPAWTMTVRTAWTAVLLLGGWLQQPARPVAAALGARAAGLATGVAVYVIVALTGGTSSIFVGMLLATPFAVLVAIPAFPSSAAITGLCLLVGGVALRLTDGSPPADVLSWAILSGAMVTLATYGTVASRNLWWRELEAERERTRVQGALAESELRRAETERLAEVGRLAAGVAHQINSPLSAVRSNVQWLGEAPGEEPERAVVVDETIEAVDRIATIVADLRRAAFPTTDPVPPPPPAARQRFLN